MLGDAGRARMLRLGKAKVMEDHASDQATSHVEPDGGRVLPRRSTRVDVQDLGFKYTA